LGIRVGGVGINGVLDGLVVGLDGNLTLASTALVLVVLELAGGDLLSAHVCDVIVFVLVVLEMVFVMLVMFWCVVEMFEKACDGLCLAVSVQAVLMAFP